MDFDPVLLSRIQFAFTISFHILFPAFTIGLASWLAVIEWRYLKTGDDLYRRIYQFWVKIFAVTFGMGVVSGVVMSYQFGTNWSAFSDKVGNVMGPLLGFEALTAFFLEASFLGIMLFGWGRVSKRLHFVSTVLVAFGTLLSAFWILSANSWMHTPVGHRVEDGIFYPESWLAIIFNPSMPYRFVHMVLAAYLTTACVVTGIGAFYLWRGRFVRHARVMLSYGLWFLAIAAPAQLIAGDLHGLNTFEHQPAKVAAMEGNWETQKGAPLLLFAVPDQDKATNHYEIGIPGGASYLLTHDWQGEVPGLKQWPESERPDVPWVFYSFRAMVGIGMFMIAGGLIGLYLRWRGRLYETRWFQYMCMALTPMGFCAVLAGWFVTEIGRQPWLVYGELSRSQGVSPVPGDNVAVSLAVFVIVYTLVFGAGTYYILKLIGKGPESHSPSNNGDDDRGTGLHPLQYGDLPAES